MKGTDCITFRMSADVDGLKDVADQTKRVVKAARKLEKEIAKLAGMEVTVRVRPERPRC